MTAVLCAAGVTRALSGGGQGFTLVVEHIALAAGMRIAVTGPSGCGKSTLLGLLGLAIRPDSGTALRLLGTDTLALWRDRQFDALARLRARSLGFVAQEAALLPFLSIGENIALPQAMLGRREPARIATLAERLGIAAVLRRRPAELSVGQRQRVALARALAARPALLLADEPSAALHPTQAAEAFDLLREAAAEGAAVLACTHNAAQAERAGFAVVPCRPEPGETLTRVGVPFPPGAAA